MEIDIITIESKLNYVFQDKNLLITAFTHSSYANECINERADYERLEFVGDSLIGAVVAEYLYIKYPNLNQGELSKIKAVLVSARLFAKIINKLDLVKYLQIGEALRGVVSDRLKGDLFEGIIGAIYIDSNSYNVTKKIVIDLLDEYINKEYNIEELTDYKSRIFEMCAKNSWEIKFITDKCIEGFISQLFINGKALGLGTGQSKKQAEQKASKDALTKV
ncbi:MAG TPA: ribonuclease III [Clostridia bacterium]|jgi:ribonuclease-3|nr:ribonuclease III [Clostridia bacterium]